MPLAAGGGKLIFKRYVELASNQSSDAGSHCVDMTYQKRMNDRDFGHLLSISFKT